MTYLIPRGSSASTEETLAVALVNPVTGLPSSSNITTKFREAFELDPNTSGNWAVTTASGDIITVDGNAVAASYAVVSLNPLATGTQSSLMTVDGFSMPVEMAVGLSLSQRPLGQEFSIELVSDDTPLATPADLAIATISQATTTLTVDTTLAHNLRPGMCIGIFGCADSRFNYPALVVATTPTATQFTATAGPGGNIPSVTAGPFTSGTVYLRSRLGYAVNGTSMIFENATATNASFYIRSESGDVLPSGTVTGSHSTTIATTASVQAINAARTYAFQPTTEYRATLQADRLQWSDVAVDQVGQSTNRVNRTQVIPDPAHSYKFRIRASNNKGLTVPVAHISSVAKSGTTTATVTTQTPHGLTTGDVIAAYGVRDQTNFANLTAATAVASVIDANNFTVVWGSAVTATSQSGVIYRVNGGNLPSTLGAIAQVVQSVARTSNILTVVGNASWSGLLIGDYVNLVAIHDTLGAEVGVDGAYRVQNIATTTLTLEPINATVSPTGTDIVTVNCGGAVIKRTDLRVSFVRVFDYERERVEVLPRPSGDLASAFPVAVNNTPAVTLASTTIAGTVAVDAAIGAPVTAGLRASNANIAAMSATGDNVAWLGTMIGAGIIKPYALPEAGFNASLALTTTTAAAIQAAGGAGIKRHLTAVQAINTGASTVDLIILDGATERWRLPLPVNVPVSITLPTEIVTTANTALNANLSASGTVRANFQGYTAP